jgi:hypothetical protein
MDAVPIQRVIDLVKSSGGDAVLDGDMLTVYPAGRDPVAYVVPPNGLKRRVIIEIAKRVGLPSHYFWQPDAAAPAAPLRKRGVGSQQG